MIENLAEVIEDYERGFDSLIREVWSGQKEEEQAEEMWNDPFMRAGRASVSRPRQIEMPGAQTIRDLPG